MEAMVVMAVWVWADMEVMADMAAIIRKLTIRPKNRGRNSPFSRYYSSMYGGYGKRKREAGFELGAPAPAPATDEQPTNNQ
jgi:hypothetical protein